jgi:hypothetical protein
MNKERIKTQEKKHHDVYYGKLDGIISSLQKALEQGWEGIDYDYDYDGHKEYYLYRTRIETDEEYEKRMKVEEKRKENRRKQYEELRKEFGNDD